jgi:hypothetical protein
MFTIAFAHDYFFLILKASTPVLKSFPRFLSIKNLDIFDVAGI